ncbi:hypothetical protein B0H10DRAFT_2039154 [Mycena sp. CBHHK59/15]|nr:hypothetical protein B0H10DRAFT_2039154 [Mycena sp. CBHHK59/15]
MTSKNNLPRSFSYPNIVVIERALRGQPKLRPGMTLPYELCADGRVLSYEFRGIGIPPNDIGRPGDIFWDTTFPYILYFAATASARSRPLAQHPSFRDRYLWMSGSGFAWLVSSGLQKAHMDMRQFYALDDTSLGLDFPDNRRRYDEEVRRRRHDGVAVGEVSAMSHIPHGSDALSTSGINTSLIDEFSETSSEIFGNQATDSSSIPLKEETQAEDNNSKQQLSTEIETLKSENARLKLLLAECQENSDERVRVLLEKSCRDDEELRDLRHLKASVGEVLEELETYRDGLRGAA